MTFIKNPCLALCLAAGIAAGMLSAQAPEDVAQPRPAAEDSQKAAEPQDATAPQPAPADSARGEQHGFKKLETPPEGSFVIQPGTRILLNMINSISTKQAAVGDRIYLETAFPVLQGNRVIVPQGSWVQGTVMQVKRPGRMKGRGELYVRFDSLTLPNGVTRDFRARMGAMDGRATEEVNKEEGKIKAPGSKGKDAATVAGTAAAGAGLGSMVGISSGSSGMGAGIGGAAGAAAGLAGVLLSRGPDATLTKGTTMEMVLDRPVAFSEADLDFSHVVPRAALADGAGPVQTQQPNSRRWPF
jgi:type IV secretion system protein VirB10